MARTPNACPTTRPSRSERWRGLPRGYSVLGAAGHGAESALDSTAWYLAPFVTPAEVQVRLPSHRPRERHFRGARPGAGVGRCRVGDEASNPAVVQLSVQGERGWLSKPAHRETSHCRIMQYLDERRLLGDTSASPHPGPRSLRHGLRGVGKSTPLAPAREAPMMQKWRPGHSRSAGGQANAPMQESRRNLANDHGIALWSPVSRKAFHFRSRRGSGWVLALPRTSLAKVGYMAG